MPVSGVGSSSQQPSSSNPAWDSIMQGLYAYTSVGSNQGLRADQLLTTVQGLLCYLPPTSATAKAATQLETDLEAYEKNPTAANAKKITTDLQTLQKTPISLTKQQVLSGTEKFLTSMADSNSTDTNIVNYDTLCVMTSAYKSDFPPSFNNAVLSQHGAMNQFATSSNSSFQSTIVKAAQLLNSN